MKWFLLQSFAVIVVTTLLTMLFCWLWFRARYRVVSADEVTAVGAAGSSTLERTERAVVERSNR